ncbi:MAG: M24 family metallopeptidase [Ignavibacteriales bacterium]|nr:MAG: M24 family metallopeptidase [Ignavibacteriales bacterium]
MKKLLLSLFALASFLIVSCANNQNEQANTLWKKNPNQILTKEEINKEISDKMILVQKFLTEKKLDGMLFTQVRNVYWITAGQANVQIVLNKDVGAASLLIMKDGKKYLVCNGAEAGRMMDGSLRELGYELKMYNWYEANPVKDVRESIIKEIAPKGKIGSDAPFPGTVVVAEDFRPLRYSLSETELKRYKWLGQQCTEAVESVCKSIKPGMDEYELEALTAIELRSRGIFPTVLLTAVDNRIFNYRHALPGGAVLENYAMINIVAEKWGMPIAVTRFVYFGDKLPAELENKLKQTAIVMSKYEEATKPGKALSEIFEECKQWYADAGFEGEWMKHHQGGAIGYDDREFVIYPGVKGTVQNNQGYAWNPTITGAKVEDTFIANENGGEVITKTKDWPVLIVNLNGKKYEQPAILLRDKTSGKIIEQKNVEVN